MGNISEQKETIVAQPNAIERIISNRLDGSKPAISFDTDLSEQFFRSITNIHIVASGSSEHAGQFAQRLFDSLTTLETTVHPSTEYTSETISRPERTLVIGLSRSGETADVLSALRTVNGCGVTTLGITATPQSSIGKVTDSVVVTDVPDTSAINQPLTFTTSSTVLSLFALLVAIRRDDIPPDEIQSVIDELRAVPAAMGAVADDKMAIKNIADQHTDTDTIICLGRQLGTPVAIEAAHQLMRSAKIRSKGLPAGELKHRGLPMVNKDTAVLVTAVNGSCPGLMKTHVREIIARDAPVIGVTSDDTLESEFTERFVIPEAGRFESLVASVCWQLFSYHLLNSDHKRN